MSVTVQQLNKVYEKQFAVNDLSFTANKGEITGFLGPNGAGKSTTMKIITCYTPPTSGQVQVCGLNVESQSFEIRKKIGYLPEHNPLYLDMYVHEYLELVASLHQLKSKRSTERRKEVISLCGLEREQNKKIAALSKGYRQRVGLAQALIHDPEVLILDEPTTGLDPNQLVEIRGLIKNISQDKTVILSTHIMQEVQALCDKVVIINKGKLVADDKVSNLTNLGSKQLRVFLKFSSSVDLNFLQEREEVAKLEALEDHTYCVFFNEIPDPRTELIQKCMELKLPLVEIYSEEKSMEDVFHLLTK